jgi:hypothetical protein
MDFEVLYELDENRSYVSDVLDRPFAWIHNHHIGAYCAFNEVLATG